MIFQGWAKQKEKKLIVGMTFSLAGRFCGDLIVTNRPQEADDVWEWERKRKKGKNILSALEETSERMSEGGGGGTTR